MPKANQDRVMAALRRRFDDSGLSLDEFGRRMGYNGPAARKSAWQFLNSTADPRLSMVRRAAKAVGVKMSELFGED